MSHLFQYQSQIALNNTSKYTQSGLGHLTEINYVLSFSDFPYLSLTMSLFQCFKSIKESTPHTELPLNLCNVIYVPKEGKKKRHELRFSLPGGEALVLAVQSKEQAQRWLKVPFIHSAEAGQSSGGET